MVIKDKFVILLNYCQRVKSTINPDYIEVKTHFWEVWKCKGETKGKIIILLVSFIQENNKRLLVE